MEVTSSSGIQASGGTYHSMMLKQDGSVWATDRDYYGQLGDGSRRDKFQFEHSVSSGAATVATGYGHSMMPKQDGSVWVTGQNNKGQLGDGSNANKGSFCLVAREGDGV